MVFEGGRWSILQSCFPSGESDCAAALGLSSSKRRENCCNNSEIACEPDAQSLSPFDKVLQSSACFLHDGAVSSLHFTHTATFNCCRFTDISVFPQTPSDTRLQDGDSPWYRHFDIHRVQPDPRLKVWSSHVIEVKHLLAPTLWFTHELQAKAANSSYRDTVHLIGLLKLRNVTSCGGQLISSVVGRRGDELQPSIIATRSITVQSPEPQEQEQHSLLRPSE